jgi:hypothetical protein
LALDRAQEVWLLATYIDARHAKAALKIQINKSDRNDAFAIAPIMRRVWLKEVLG